MNKSNIENIQHEEKRKDRIRVMLKILLSIVFTMISVLQAFSQQQEKPLVQKQVQESKPETNTPDSKQVKDLTKQEKTKVETKTEVKLKPAAIEKAPVVDQMINAEVQKIESLKKEDHFTVQEDPQNELGLIYSAKKLEEITALYNEGKTQEAENLLLPVKEWLTEVTQYHYDLGQNLNKALKTLPESKIERAHAIDFGHLRDKSYYLLAKIYISDNKQKEAIKLLVEIIKSQPDSEIGIQAYKTLQEIKFSDKPKHP